MSEIEGEVVEPQDSSEAVEATEPVDATDSIEASEPAEEAAPVEASADSDTSAVIDWNGEVSSMKDAEWFNKFEEGTRQALLQGMETKYKNWQRGYTKAFEDNAARRKALEDRETVIKGQETRVSKWLYGEKDPIADLKTEIETLKQSHEESLLALKEEHEKSVGQASSGRTEELETLMKERDGALSRIQEFENQVKAREEAEITSAVDEFEVWIKETAEDVYANDEAFYSLCVLCTGGIERSDALAMVRGKYKMPEPEPEPTAPTPEPVPQSMSLMNLGTGQAGGTSQGEARDFNEIIDALRREAQTLK